MPIATEAAAAGLGAVHLDAPPGWFAAHIPLDYPVAVDRRPLLQRSMRRLVELLRVHPASSRTICLHLNALSPDTAIKQIASNGRTWSPEMGLGVVPGGPSPRFWTSGDFLDRNYDQPIPELMETVVLLHADEAGAQHACDTMTGSGGLIQVLHRDATEQLQAAWHDRLQPGITEPGLAAYAVYIPLISEAAFGRPDDLSRVIEPVELYMREDSVAGNILLLSRRSLASALGMAGFQLDVALREAERLQSNANATPKQP